MIFIIIAGIMQFLVYNIMVRVKASLVRMVSHCVAYTIDYVTKILVVGLEMVWWCLLSREILFV